MWAFNLGEQGLVAWWCAYKLDVDVMVNWEADLTADIRWRYEAAWLS